MFRRDTHAGARILVAVVVALTAVVQSVWASSDDAPPEAWSHARHVSEVEAAGASALAAALAAYDKHLAERDDVAVAVERCRLMAYFANSESATPLATSFDLERCHDGLRSGRYVNDPVALVYLFEQTWGEEAQEEGARLIAASGYWSAKLRARLHARMAVLHELGDEQSRAGWHAVRAAELDPGTSVLLTAAQHLELQGAKQRARSLITAAPASVFEGPSVYDAATLLVRLGDAAGALRLLQGRADEERGDLFSVANAMAAGGQPDAARQLFATALEEKVIPPGVMELRSYFIFERDRGTSEQARAAYERLRQAGFYGDPFGRYRLALLFKSPAASWAIADGAGALALLAALAFGVLLPLVVVAPIHYLSLVRRLRGRSPAPSPLPWGLGHGWYALAGVLVTGLVAVYIFAYPEFELAFDMAPYDGPLSDDRALGRALLFSVVGLVLLAVPMTRGVKLLPLLEGQWPLRKSLTTATFLLLGLRFIAGLWSSVAAGTSATLGSDTTRAMQGIYADHGPFALILVAVVLVPIVEEFLFRGVLLNALARHVPFWVAAFGQACVFALLHEEVANMPLLTVIGVMAAWLYRRSQGLVAPIAFHVFNNALACLAIIRATSALERI